MSEQQNDGSQQNERKNDEKNRFKKILFFIASSFRRISNQVGGISLKYFRSPTSIFWSIVYPVILILLFGAMFGRTIDTNYTLDVYDLDKSAESEIFIATLSELPGLTINEIEEEIDLVDDWLSEKNKVILLEIPETYGLRIGLNLTSSLTVYYDPSSATAKIILEIIEEVVSMENIYHLEIDVKYDLLLENLYTNELSFIDSLVPGIIMITISTIALFTSLSYDLEEKRSGILQKLATTPANKFEWIVSKQIWQIFIAILAGLLTVLFALIYSFNVASLHPLMLVYIIFGTMTFSGIAMILVRIITNPDGVIIASVLITIPQILLSGALVPLDSFPELLQFISRIFPLYYLTEGMRFLMLEAASILWWRFFLISAAMAIGFFTLGIFATNWKRDS
ncbi:MAG: ABC transporter permease [Candidatus Heimdallarchaeota archaeon]|nr:ABC transporter permease [Candidatus Heimdallarchaeota archaeon]MBY8994313.1 ABC transporter permease [Candidatus Heimdallarchaeota archaeon]